MSASEPIAAVLVIGSGAGALSWRLVEAGVGVVCLERGDGLTEDIAKACAFLASDQASYITGEALNVSGGEEMH